MATIGLVVRAGVKDALAHGQKVVEWAKSNGHNLRIEHESANAMGIQSGSYSAEEITSTCDPVIALGGDGTLIGVGRHVSGKSPVMIGVNFGRLGFLTEIAPHELFDTLDSVLKGTASVGNRHLLSCSISRASKEISKMQAVNDVVLHKGVFDKLMEIDLRVDNQKVSTIRCDGLIISTPTGSTAYSLSAGGPIVYPTLAVVVVTPICSHSLTHRPLVLGNDSEISISVPRYDGQVALTIDGQEGASLHVGDIVRITKSLNSVIFVRSPSQGYFEILHDKLNWGASS